MQKPKRVKSERWRWGVPGSTVGVRALRRTGTIAVGRARKASQRRGSWGGGGVSQAGEEGVRG